MDLLLNQASAIVSGGTKGIGLAIVNNFLKEGMNVTTFSRNKKNIDSTKRKFNSFSSQINILEANILDEDNCKKIIASHIKKFKTLDILVNNAGESIKNGTTKDKWGQSFDINVTAHVILSELVIPHLEKSKIGGNIVNISSIFGRESGGNPQYNASKAAMISFSKSFISKVFIFLGSSIITESIELIIFIFSMHKNSLIQRESIACILNDGEIGAFIKNGITDKWPAWTTSCTAQCLSFWFGNLKKSFSSLSFSSSPASLINAAKAAPFNVFEDCLSFDSDLIFSISFSTPRLINVCITTLLL